jgi:hypothetical protein
MTLAGRQNEGHERIYASVPFGLLGQRRLWLAW